MTELRLSPENQVPLVAIIGAGFSGTMVAANLIRHSEGKIAVVLIDGWQVCGQGIAYGRCEATMLLNVRAASMGAWADDPAGFIRWCAHYAPEVQPGDYAPRALYGEYMRQLVEECNHTAGALLKRVKEEIERISYSDQLFTLAARSGNFIRANAVVFATGNMAPQNVAERSTTAPSHVEDPWREGALKDIEQLQRIGIIGTGLTAIDVIVHALAKGYQGSFFCLSRRGLFPRAHLATEGQPYEISLQGWGGTLRELVSLVRAQCDSAPSWQSVIDGLRPHSASIWRRFSNQDKGRFLRHLRTYWDVHRHRVPLHVHTILERLVAEQRLVVKKGRVASISTIHEGAVVIAIRGRSESDIEQIHVQRVVNCTGPQSGIQTNRLLKGAVTDKILREDVQGLGVMTDVYGRACTDSGPIWVIGPLRRPDQWESTAVRELRVQASEIAGEIIRHFSARTPSIE